MVKHTQAICRLLLTNYLVKHTLTQTICRLLSTNCLGVFDHFVGLAPKGLTQIRPVFTSTCLYMNPSVIYSDDISKEWPRVKMNIWPKFCRLMHLPWLFCLVYQVKPEVNQVNLTSCCHMPEVSLVLRAFYCGVWGQKRNDSNIFILFCTLSITLEEVVLVSFFIWACFIG